MITDFKFLAQNQKFAVSGAQPLGGGWESSSFDGSHIISVGTFENEDEKIGEEHALKIQVVKPSMGGPHILRWNIPNAKTGSSKRWVLSFYARTKEEPLDVRSSVLHSKDASGTNTTHHMSPHLISKKWKKFISVVHLDGSGVRGSSSLSVFFFLPKSSTFNLDLARVELKKESSSALLNHHLKSGDFEQSIMFASGGSIFCIWKMVSWIFKVLSYPFKIVLEFVYRFCLWLWINYRIPEYFTVYNKSFWVFDRELGFNYTPGDKITQVTFDNKGNVRSPAEHYINLLGNVGHDDGRTFQQAKLKILTFGDSFTVGTGGVVGGFTWPDLLRKNLAASLHGEVSVINFGRDGTGLLNMFDIAAAKVPVWKPDLFIIAFIFGDLHRGRFWRTVNTVDGYDRVLVTADPNPNPNPKHCADAAMINTKMTTNWMNQRMNKKLPPDDVARNVLSQYLYLQKEAHRHVDLFDFSRRFFEKKILFNDPFHGLTSQYTNCPPFQKKSYAEDEKMFQNVQKLKATGIPMILVHLPAYEVFWDRVTEFQKNELFQSLAQLCGTTIIELKDFYNEDFGPIKDLYRWQVEDWHYSEAGLKFVADSLADMLFKALPQSLKSCP